MPEIGAGDVSAAGPATCAAYAPVTSAAAAKISQHRLIARSGGSGRELASNRDPPRFPFICLNRRLESSLGGVPIGADAIGFGIYGEFASPPPSSHVQESRPYSMSCLIRLSSSQSA